ncbi:conserved hypothetical protein [Ricinus communis]|uniref:PORR domain-containing protein n=1 Tax=Ricinus communis TaxID=3988 RepID=B9T4A1_RICCO|nr:conserved hypothetical protein [Ricinus communis]
MVPLAIIGVDTAEESPCLKISVEGEGSKKVGERETIEKDKRYKLCSRVVKEVLNEPGQVIPLRYIEKRRERLRLHVKVKTFVNQNPGLFGTYYDRIKPKTDPVMFLRVSDRVKEFLEEEKRIQFKNEGLIVSKLCKLLMMAKNKVLSADKLVHVKREFGFPNDFMVNLVPKYPNYFRLIGCPGEGKSFLELVDWNPEFAKSVIELRAEEESRLMGIRVRPNFSYKLPPGFFLKKEMREWVRDWLELDYISPYVDVSHLDQASPEMEKRTVGVFHELLSLSLLRGSKGWLERAEQLRSQKEVVTKDMEMMAFGKLDLDEQEISEESDWRELKEQSEMLETSEDSD